MSSNKAFLGSLTDPHLGCMAAAEPLRDRNVSLAAFATHMQPQPSQQAPPAWHMQPALPAPWISPEAVTSDMVDRRCPGGMRSRAYRRCIRESFAWAGLYGRWDGLAERITFYEVWQACCPCIIPLDSGVATCAYRPVCYCTWHPALHAWIVHGSCRIFSGKTSQGCISISIAAHLARMQDDERTRVTEVRELFQRRVDKLRERRVYPADSTCQVAC